MAALPIVGRAELLAALVSFDQELRDTVAWAGWEVNAAHIFAAVHDGKRYPPKRIIFIATGMPADSFSGGHQSNTYLTALGFEVARLEHNRSLKLAPSFLVGRVYDRWSEINDPYSGSRQSGISASRVTPAIFLFRVSQACRTATKNIQTSRECSGKAAKGKLSTCSLRKATNK